MRPAQGSRPLPPWLRPLSERLLPATRALVVVAGISLLFYGIVIPARGVIDGHLALGPAALRGEPWQIVTALFVERHVLALLSMLGLWYVGGSIERAWGRRRFLTLYFGCGISANAVAVLLGAWWGLDVYVSGCGESVLGLFVAFGVLHGRMQTRVIGALVLQARTLAALFVGLTLASSAAARAWHLVVGTLVSVALAAILAGGRGRGLRAAWTGWRRGASRHRYQIIEGGRAPRRRDDLN